MDNLKIDLSERKCVPCSGKEEPLKKEEAEKFLGQIKNGWQLIDNKKLRNKYPFDNFKLGMAFVQDVAILADEEQHHPDICIHYSNVEVELTTHAIGGLSENDFILAAKIDNL
jgi:4a-hydroxytetrahydrobiopterin dehydratase